MIISIKFEIDDALALLAIEALLSEGVKKVTKNKVVELCREYLHAEGELFETEPTFPHGDTPIDYEKAEAIFNKIWIDA